MVSACLASPVPSERGKQFGRRRIVLYVEDKLRSLTQPGKDLAAAQPTNASRRCPACEILGLGLPYSLGTTRMPAVFDDLGICFEYPDNWSLEERDEGEQSGDAQIVISGPQTAFWHLSKHPANVDMEALFDETLAAMRAQYPDMEVEPADDLTAEGGWMDRDGETGSEGAMGSLQGFNVNFICFDLTVTAWLRGFRTGTASYLLLCQAEDRELPVVGPVFRAMWISLLRNDGAASVKTL